MAHAALLGGIGASDADCSYASFGGIPGELLGDTRKVGSTHVGIHGSGLVLHRGYRELFISKLCVGMLSKTLVDGPIDLTTHIADKSLPALTS